MDLDFPVSAAKLARLRDRMAELGLAEADLEETFVRSSGPGGQNVNKVATRVVLVHRPSGLTVRCQAERSQALNRYLARVQLVGELEAKARGQESAKERAIWKLRKQKRKRSKRAKAKILRDKRLHAEKKELRRPVL